MVSRRMGQGPCQLGLDKTRTRQDVKRTGSDWIEHEQGQTGYNMNRVGLDKT